MNPPVVMSGALALACACALGITAAPAHAEDAYRYWSFWLEDSGEWSYAQQGPATIAARDGQIYGWKFGIARESDPSAPQPGIGPAQAWQEACGAVAEAEDSARIAVVLDFGSTNDAPDGETPPDTAVECAVVPDGSSGVQALNAVADIRSESGLICAFDGYPASECAPSITVSQDSEETADSDPMPSTGVTPDHGSADSEPSPQATAAAEPADPSSTNVGALLIAGAAILAAFVVIALIATRRSRGGTR